MSLSTHPCVDSYTPAFRLALAFRQSYVEAMTYVELQAAARHVVNTSSIGGWLKFTPAMDREDAIANLLAAVLNAGGGDFKGFTVLQAKQIMKKEKERLIRQQGTEPTMLTVSPAAITAGQALDEAFEAPEGMAIAADLAEGAMVEAMAKGSVDMLGLPPQFVLDVRHKIPPKTLAEEYNVTQNQARLLTDVVEDLIVQLSVLGMTAKELDKEIDELLTFEVI